MVVHVSWSCFTLMVFTALFLPGAFVTNGNINNGKAVSPTRSYVYGPGINSNKYPLPIQYIYTQLNAIDGNKYTGLVNEDSFQIEFSSPGERVFVHNVVHYLGDGLFVVRYRLHREVKSLTISLKYEGSHIDQSPYFIGVTLVDKCYCPKRSLQQWLTDFECPTHYDQINSDLSPYRSSGIQLDGLYDRLMSQYRNTHGVHYSIINNKIYGRTFGTITDFRFMSDLILTSLANKVSLPNIELIVQVSDWPQDTSNSGKDPFPFFSWCGSESSRDIVWPQYDLLRHTIQAMDRVTLDMIMLQDGRKIPWEERIPKGFFRGRDSNRARLDLVREHREHTDLFNVSLTQFFFHEYSQELYGDKVNRVPFLEFFKYKYQLNIDGTVAAYRFPFLMAGGSLIFKQDSEYYEHFYHQLEPWVHYIPLNRDISDVVEKLQWAKEHDNEARQIAENAYKFVVDNLLPDKLFCYMFTLLKEYSKLQRGTPKIHRGMSEVVTEDNHLKSSCKLCTMAASRVKDEF